MPLRGHLEVSRQIGLLLALAASTTGLAKEPPAKAVYCWQGAKGDWTLHRFKPLIKVEGGTVFAELSFAGSALSEVRLRHFYPDSELAFDYRFDAAGKLAGLRGTVQVKSAPPPGIDSAAEPLLLADWVGEADLLPGSDGRIPPHHVLYTRERDRIEKPAEAEKYIARFDDAPVYQTVATVPCAAMLKEAETMNATQE